MSSGKLSRLATILVWGLGGTVIVLLGLLPVIGPRLIGPQESDGLIFFGRFHIVLLHIPIGVFVWISVMEAGRVLTFRRWNPEVTWALAFGAVMAAATAVLGYLLLRDAGSSVLLTQHMWTGLAFAALAILAFLFRFSGRNLAYLAALAATLAMMTISAHFGASSVHGSAYLTKYAPAWAQKYLGGPEKVADPSLRSEPTVFLVAIAPILNARCASCHNADKAKGGLDVTTFAALAKGGEAGPGFVAGDPAQSLIVQRMELPLESDDHMPPAGKPQPEVAEIGLLKWWIASGASASVLMQDISIPEEWRGALDVKPEVPEKPQVDASAAQAAIAPALEQFNREFPSSAVFAGKDSADILVSTAAIRTAFGDAGLDKLAPLSQAVVDLDLGGSGVTDAGMPVVARLSRLTRLRLENTAVTDRGVEALKPLANLESLSLYGCAVTDGALAAIAQMPALKRVYLGSTPVSPGALAALKQQAPNLEIIMPPDPASFPEIAKKPPADGLAPDGKPTHFTTVIQPVLRKHCAVCHNDKRMSGDLDVTSFRSLISAGDGVNENVIVPNDPAESLMIKRIKLPLDDKHHMPPKRRPQMKPEEIALLTKWVQDGAREE